MSWKLVHEGPDDSQVLVAPHKLPRLTNPAATREDFRGDLDHGHRVVPGTTATS
jgi:hypothetical protein